jgi:hypothetical protein
MLVASLSINSANPIFYSVNAAIKKELPDQHDTTFPLSAHSIHTRLIVFWCLMQISFDIVLHHQVSEIRIASDAHDVAGGEC